LMVTGHNRNKDCKYSENNNATIW